MAVSGCGGDDKKDAEQTVRDFVEALNTHDADRYCDELITKEFLEKTTFTTGDEDKARESCKTRVQEPDRTEGEPREIEKTKVDGDNATVTAVLTRQGQRIKQKLLLKKEDGDWKLAGAGGVMPTVVVKLGSSIVADEAGELRTDVLEALCDEVAARHAAGDDVVLVTSGAIARGMRLMELPMRPTSMEELQAASAVGQGKLYRSYDELLQQRGVPSAQVLLTFFDMSARTHYLNARHTLQTLLRWRVLPVINENDTTTTDEISFGDNDFLAAQVAILIGADRLVLLTDTGGLYSADPRSDPGAQRVEEVRSLEELEDYDIGAVQLAARIGRDALEGGGRRDGHGRRDPGDDHERGRARGGGRRAGRRAERHALPSAGGARLELQALAQVREAHAGAAAWWTRAPSTRCASAARACCRWGWWTWRASSRRATPWRCAATGARSARASSNYSAAELRTDQGLKTDAVREVLPRAAEEAVHRDYFVLE